MMEAFVVKLGLTAAVFFGVLNVSGILGWVERKQSAVMQDRIGANRASIFGFRLWGLLHPLADLIKSLTKEDFIPPTGNKLLHTLAPFISVFFGLVTFAAMPIGDTIVIGGREISLQIANINVGILFIMAMMSLEVYGVVLAGFSSNNNYAALGGLRAGSQMLAYEITMGLALIGIIMTFGSLELQDIIRGQGSYLLGGWLPKWGIVVQPIGFILFLTAAMAETKRTPFDIPEGESEIIGYFVEYSGMKFLMFWMTDFILTIMVACLLTTLYFGGWQVPYLGSEGFQFPWGASIAMGPLAVSLTKIAAFSTKVTAFIWLLMAIRWTLPRFRYDQLLDLGWKIMFPISIVNIVMTGVIILAGQ